MSLYDADGERLLVGNTSAGRADEIRVRDRLVYAALLDTDQSQESQEQVGRHFKITGRTVRNISRRLPDLVKQMIRREVEIRRRTQLALVQDLFATEDD
jgi:hypothetical protein